MPASSPPIIDIGDSFRASTRGAIDAACRDWGLFQIVGHGIDDRLIAALRRQMRAMFAQPIAIKRAMSRTADNPWGFYDRELTRHTVDWKQIYDYGPADGAAMTPQWPPLPAFRPIVEAFYDACTSLSARLVRVISANLGMPGNYLDANFHPRHTSFLRMNYYPKCPAPDHLGVNAHTDSGAVTMLLQDEEPGLQVFNNGGWHLVEPLDGALVVNIGDIVQVWSNDRYKAPMHRGLSNATAERFSVPFFFNPAYDVEYAPLPSTVSARQPPHYRPISWREFRAKRAAGDYAHDGEYHQISHYSV